jgi:hypothetical protein
MLDNVMRLREPAAWIVRRRDGRVTIVLAVVALRSPWTTGVGVPVSAAAQDVAVAGDEPHAA